MVSICTTRDTPMAFGFAQLALIAAGAGVGAGAVAVVGAGAGAGVGAAALAGGGAALRCGMSACDQTLVKAQTEMALAAKTVALMRMENTPERKIPASGPADAAVVPNHEPRPTLFIAPTDFQGERWQG